MPKFAPLVEIRLAELEKPSSSTAFLRLIYGQTTTPAIFIPVLRVILKIAVAKAPIAHVLNRILYYEYNRTVPKIWTGPKSFWSKK